jgi:hypothetical protein
LYLQLWIRALYHALRKRVEEIAARQIAVLGAELRIGQMSPFGDREYTE